MVKCQGGLNVKKTICELFAGVGGFRLGFDKLQSGWETTWFSQWEPGKTKQWAHDCYVYHYGDCKDLMGEYHTGEDISTMNKNNIPEHSLLVGGFPCQDYSVAHSLSSSKGIEGKKGVLWWQIRDVLITKRPPFVMLENVDRLLKSPASQRGRDFGIILTSFAQLGYRAEWRVVNAADYGAAQRRRRTFIFAYNKNTKYAKEMVRKNIQVLEIINKYHDKKEFNSQEDFINLAGTIITSDILKVDNSKMVNLIKQTRYKAINYYKIFKDILDKYDYNVPDDVFLIFKILIEEFDLSSYVKVIGDRNIT